MKVFITGATGFLGKYIVDLLSQKGYDCIAFGRNQSIGESLVSDRVTFIKGDFTNYNEVLNAMDNIDFVIHAGALSTVWGSWKSFYDANILGTENVLKASLEKKVKRFIFISSPSIYASKKDRLNIKESEFDPKNKLNNYIRSKVMAEDLVHTYNQRGLYTVILRPRGIFGVGDTSIVPRLLAANDKSGIPLLNKGKNLVDITYVENVAHAIYLSLIQEDINNEVFNITNDEPTAFKIILEKFFDAIGVTPRFKKIPFKVAYFLAFILEKVYRKEPPLTRYTVCTIGVNQTLDITHAKNKLGYQPIYTIDEGVKIYATWWKDNNHKNI